MGKNLAIGLLLVFVILIGVYIVMKGKKSTGVLTAVPTPTSFISETPTFAPPTSVSPEVTQLQVTVVVTPTPVKKVTLEVTPTISAQY